jgi:predicted ArsR family transcriptional regulator
VVFAALRDARRRRLLSLAAAQYPSVAAIADDCGLDLRTCRRHLGILECSGLLQVKLGTAWVRPPALLPLRDYFDAALTLASVFGHRQSVDQCDI